jgi:hypothetical protein
MPTRRRQLRGRMQLKLDDLSMREQVCLGSGCLDNRPAGILTPETLPEVWQAVRDEYLAQWWERHPGQRPFAMWRLELLPRAPRRRVEHDDDLPATSKDPIGGEPWISHDGYESSYRYLRRRGLFQEGEVDRIRTAYNIAATLEYYRGERNRVDPKYRGNVGFTPWELADILDLFGPEILTPDELRQASEYRITT